MIHSSRIKQLLIFGLLALVSYAVIENFISKQSNDKYKPFTKGYALTDVIIESTDETGRIVTMIKSPAVTHYADSEKTVIKEPAITLFESNGNWFFNSELGEINSTQTEIFFPKNVVADLIDDNSTDIRTQITTSELTVNINKKLGTTPAAMEITELGSLIKGIGAKLNFEQQEFEMLNEFYAEYEN